MRNTEIGASRDRKILLEIEKCGVLDTEQIRVLFFRHLAHGRRIAQKRLQKLYERGKLQRQREYGRPYCYHIEPFKNPEHRLGINWIYCWFVANLKTWEVLQWRYEVDIGGIRPDAIARVYNKVNKTEKIICIEFDRDTGSDIKEKYIDENVFVVTTGKVEQFAGFDVMQLEEIKRRLGSA